MFKKIISGILVAAMLFTVNPISAKAALTTDEEQLKESIYDVVYLLKELFDTEYSGIEEELENLIKNKNYDYSLTMESFYEQPNPFKDADCIRYLSAYMACKKYAKDNSISIPQLNEIPFITYKAEPCEEQEYTPTKIDRYIQDEYVLDEYWKSGTEYITSQVEVPVYEQQQNGRFKMTGETKVITPDSKTIKYSEIKLNVIKPDEIFKYLGIDEDEVIDDYERRVAKIKKVTSNEAIISTLTINLPNLLPDTEDYSSYFADLDDVRKTVLATALSLRNKVPYEWGGKATSPGLDPKWWSFNPSNGLQHGLDCSGFVQWTFMTAGFPKEIYKEIYSTKNMLSKDMTQVSKEELKPGDMGCTNRLDGKVNHIGIYLGDDLWIHCSSAKKTVTVSKCDFTVFFSPYGDIESLDTGIITAYAQSINALDNNIINKYTISNNIDTASTTYYTQNCVNDDVVLLAKLIYNEARGEGLNGWIGVGEVVLNRMMSEKFPNTVEEVIYEDGQFSHSERLEGITPTEEMITVAQMVLSGNLKIINNPEVLYFRNPQITNGVPSTTPLDWGLHKWYMAIGSHAFYLQ